MEPPATPDVAIELVARSAPLPLTRANDVAVVASDRACVFDSYQVRIVCGNREWTDTRTFGREGEGPGEIISGSVVRGANGTVWFHDLRQGRLSRFTTEGEFIGGTPVNWFLISVGAVTRDGWFGGAHPPMPGTGGELWLRWVSVSADTTYAQHLVVPESAMGNDSILMGAVLLPSGEMVVGVGRGRIAWFDSGGTFLRTLQVPDLEPTRRTQRELAEEAAEGRLFYELIGRPPPDDLLEGMNEQLIGPRAPAPVNETLAGDMSGRLWMLSRRPSGSGTYVEVFDRNGYLGAIELDGLVRSITIGDSLLVALVDNPPGEMGVVPRRLDWYRIREP